MQHASYYSLSRINALTWNSKEVQKSMRPVNNGKQPMEKGSSAWNRLTVDITVKITINKSKLDIRTMHITLQIRSAKSYYCVYFAVSCSFLVKWRTLMHRMHKQSSQMCCCFSHQHERNAWHIGRDNGVRFRLPLILKKKKKNTVFVK